MLFFLLSACGKEDEQDIGGHIHNATIKVNVYLQQGGVNGQFTYTPISNVAVDLYETSYDRDNSINLLFSRTTDSAGLAVLYNLELEYYYLRVSHPAYGAVEDETSTPDGSVSLVEIDF